MYQRGDLALLLRI